ncbi:MAG: hypothetical protein QS98_C0012G0006 [archaeon GW2011_AR3]|nr:MAG: hypothetical protein QS98_C0012G0006 [archaeon GW2011_AR3]MBS3108989.1 hypothetical protein [Candidatus Woesearchaeota archaeon]
MSNTKKIWKAKGRFTTGFEMEMFTLDKEGHVVYEQDYIISRAKKYFKDVSVVKEVGKHMVEVGSQPSSDLRTSFNHILYTLEKTWEVAEKKNLLLYPFATYPGEFNPEINSSFWYDIRKKILGEEKFKMSGLCLGFHFHFAVPKNIFSRKKRVIVTLPDKKEQQSFISGYNFLIAADPVVTTFMQSSPYIQGTYLAKDSRMLFYRGGENLKFNGLYNDFQIFGGLQSYIYTITDLAKLIQKRYDLLKSQLIHWGFDPRLIKKYAKKLDTAWNPVKVNKHGTYEQRGMDMNLPSYCLSVSALLQLALKRIVEEHIAVVPSDVGIYRPFKLEGKKLHIPPISIVQENLQHLSATEGLSNIKILRYCKALVQFAQAGDNQDQKRFMTRISSMLSEKKTISDKIIEKIKSLGFDDSITADAAATLAEGYAYEFLDDIDYTKALLS